MFCTTSVLEKCLQLNSCSSIKKVSWFWDTFPKPKSCKTLFLTTKAFSNFMEVLHAKWWWSCVWDNDWNQTQWNIITLLLVWKSSFYKSINSHVFLSVVGYLYNRSSLMTSFTDWFRKKAIILSLLKSKGGLISEGIFSLVMSSKRMCKIYHYPQLSNIIWKSSE